MLLLNNWSLILHQSKAILPLKESRKNSYSILGLLKLQQI